MISGWIGVDFDGTLAEHHEHSSFPGKPVPKMIEKEFINDIPESYATLKWLN